MKYPTIFLVTAAFLVPGCSLLGLDDFDLTPCETNADCEGANLRFSERVSECERFLCARDTLTCQLRVLDEDGDGAGAVRCGGDDCDDTDPNRFARNPESCDGVDNDCDLIVDEESATLESSSSTIMDGQSVHFGWGQERPTIATPEPPARWTELTDSTADLVWNDYETDGLGATCPFVRLSPAIQGTSAGGDMMTCGNWIECPGYSVCGPHPSCRLDGGACAGGDQMPCSETLVSCSEDPPECREAANGSAGGCERKELSVARASESYVSGVISAEQCERANRGNRTVRIATVSAATPTEVAQLFQREAPSGASMVDLTMQGTVDTCSVSASEIQVAALPSSGGRTLVTWSAGVEAACGSPRRFFTAGAAPGAERPVVSGGGEGVRLTEELSSGAAPRVAAWSSRGWFVVFGTDSGLRVTYVPSFDPAMESPSVLASRTLDGTEATEAAIVLADPSEIAPTIALAWSNRCEGGRVFFGTLSFDGASFGDFASTEVGDGRAPAIASHGSTVALAGAVLADGSTLLEDSAAFSVGWISAGSFVARRYARASGAPIDRSAFLLAEDADQGFLFRAADGAATSLVRTGRQLFRAPVCGPPVP